MFKSLVWSGFFPFLGKTTTATGFPIFKKLKNWTGTIKDRYDLVFIGPSTGLDQFSLNQTETGPSQSRPMVLPYHSEFLYIIIFIIYICKVPYHNIYPLCCVLLHCCCQPNNNVNLWLVSK